MSLKFFSIYFVTVGLEYGNFIGYFIFCFYSYFYFYSYYFFLLLLLVFLILLLLGWLAQVQKPLIHNDEFLIDEHKQLGRANRRPQLIYQDHFCTEIEMISDGPTPSPS